MDVLKSCPQCACQWLADELLPGFTIFVCPRCQGAFVFGLLGEWIAIPSTEEKPRPTGN